MSIFKKIMTAIRGGAREVGEGIVDANSMRIFEQEIRDAETHLTNAKRNLTDVMAKQMQSGRELERVKANLTEHEGYVSQALEKGDETLALAVAEKISTLENDLSAQEQALNSFTGNADRLKELVKKSERQVTEHKRQLSMRVSDCKWPEARAGHSALTTGNRWKALGWPEASLDCIGNHQFGHSGRF